MDYKLHGILQDRILKWVAFPFFRESSQSRDRTQVSCIAGGFFTNEDIRESPEGNYIRKLYLKLLEKQKELKKVKIYFSLPKHLLTFHSLIGHCGLNFFKEK